MSTFLHLFLRPSTGFFSGLWVSCRQYIWKVVYQAGSKSYSGDAQWQYMNYGFVPADGKFAKVDETDEEEKTGKAQIQLYHEVANAVPIEGKNVVEVGSGRGGGAAYIARYLKPKTMTALDLSPGNVEFANNLHKKTCPNLHFQQGDALDLPLPDSSYDVVVNVESSHCYPNFPKFVSEVYRILKPGGYFVMTDLRPAEYIALMEQEMKDCGFVYEANVDITSNVVASMKTTTDRRKSLINITVRDSITNFFKKFFLSYGLEGSSLYNGLVAREILYKRYVLQKPL